MKNKFFKTIVYFILIASFIGVFFVMSIMDLMNTKDVCETSLDAATQLLVVENSINGIIPTGKDYYYIGIDDETGLIYTIHADKKWLENNFDSDGMAYGNGVYVKGLSKKISSFEVETEIRNRVNQLAENAAESGFVLAQEPGKVLKLNYIRDAIIKLIAGFLILAEGLLCFLYRNKIKDLSPGTTKAAIVVFLITLVIALWAIL